MGATMQWLWDFPPLQSGLKRLQNSCIAAIRRGPVPQHIAIIMDGNRRFARSNRIDTAEGHYSGAETLKNILEACLRAGVKVVTVYAFSIENFKRSKYEVDILMDLAKSHLNELAGHGDLLDHYKASVRILGQTALLKPDILSEFHQVQEMTKNNKAAILNVCCPYTSREEMTHSLREIVSAVELGQLDVEDIDEGTIERDLYTKDCPRPDLLIRTSGVKRLSDFLLWQCHKDTEVKFVDCYWPEFTVWRFIAVLLDYQISLLQKGTRKQE